MIPQGELEALSHELKQREKLKQQEIKNISEAIAPHAKKIWRKLKRNEIFLLCITATTVAIADGLLKEAAEHLGFLQGLTSRFMIAAGVFYLIQIYLFLYMFKKGWELGSTTNIQITLYAIIVVITGVILYGEILTVTKGIGFIFAIAGIALLQTPPPKKHNEANLNKIKEKMSS